MKSILEKEIQSSERGTATKLVDIRIQKRKQRTEVTSSVVNIAQAQKEKLVFSGQVQCKVHALDPEAVVQCVNYMICMYILRILRAEMAALLKKQKANEKSLVLGYDAVS